MLDPMPQDTATPAPSSSLQGLKGLGQALWQGLACMMVLAACLSIVHLDHPLLLAASFCLVFALGWLCRHVVGRALAHAHEQRAARRVLQDLGEMAGAVAALEARLAHSAEQAQTDVLEVATRMSSCHEVCTRLRALDRRMLDLADALQALSHAQPGVAGLEAAAAEARHIGHAGRAELDRFSNALMDAMLSTQLPDPGRHQFQQLRQELMDLGEHVQTLAQMGRNASAYPAGADDVLRRWSDRAWTGTNTSAPPTLH